MDAVKQNLASDVTVIIIELTCAGLAPRGGLAYLTNLLLTILNVSKWSEIEHAVLAAMGSEKFQLGEEVTRVTIASLRDSTKNRKRAGVRESLASPVRSLECARTWLPVAFLP